MLADAVGLGKTYMALAVIHHELYQRAGERKGTGKPVLMIVPASLRAVLPTAAPGVETFEHVVELEQDPRTP